MAEPIDSSARETASRNAASGASGRNGAARRTLPAWHYLGAAALGALNTLSFAPTPNGGWLAIAIFAAFYLWLTRTAGWKSALFTGWAFGFGNFVTGVWWLYVSMHFYGGMPAPLAGAAVALFALYLGLYPALAACIWSFCAGHASNGRAGDRPFSPTWHGAFAFASAWALGEWARGYVFTGFPWLSIGYTQVDGPLAGFAPIAGVYGVGWVLALIAALVVEALVRAWALKHQSSGHQPDATAQAHPRAPRVAVVVPAAAALALIATGLLLTNVSWTQPANTPLNVRLLQGNVKQDMKFSEAGMNAALDEFQKLITEKPADLIVTPETAIPVLLQEMPQPFARAIRHFADSTGTAILFGAVGGTVTQDGRVVDFTNSLFGITPGQPGLYRYDKHHLVPFGEFIPWGFHWFVNLMNIPLGDFARGAPVQPPFLVHNQPVAANICYEDIFGEEIARTVRENPTAPGVLINSTNLGWFGNTIALDQHLQMARMRSLETGRPMLRATNTGATAAIDARGRVIARLPVYTVGSLDVRIEGTTGYTPYVRTGNNTVIAISLLMLAFGFAFGPGRLGRGKAADKR
ncbi:apolipoprotein N-acyltransferase [Paraburkholderia dinghuensis]|uniref:Apolipoprotein N-acyltransferase n=1 Tax=Paraburkholderia dinghuensis TaxID=2305225 RepID=A0A3N6N148_9BURK|nr:apolipoprotein N-acyltransferase [Paraburkholderia dinghuensis]RQH10048.1 apolipoprotein N-acyltransferase [Paraburkholderia dinghuensis]